MVSGFPYPTPPVARGKVGRPRLSRGPTARSKARQRDQDDDSDFDEGDDVEEGGSRAQGLGFSPTTQYVLHLSLISALSHLIPSPWLYLAIWRQIIWTTLARSDPSFHSGFFSQSRCRSGS
jgi:hypothetical protein